MPPVDRLGALLTPGRRLRLSCADCGRQAHLEREVALAAFGPHATPGEVRRRARCIDCGGRCGGAVLA